MVRTVQGDLIAMAQGGEFDVIAHGCNCQCAMGAGIAKTIKATFPEAYEADLRTEKGDRGKLGTCSLAECSADTGSVVVVNAYTQFHYRGRGKKVDYDAIRGCMAWIADRYSGRRIGLPKIGAGLGGGDWATIEAIIAEELEGEDVTVVEYAG